LTIFCFTDKPETPSNFKVTDLSSTSVKLSWLAGSNGGENATFVININQEYNLTTYVDVVSESDPDPDSVESRLNLIEIRGLESDKNYEFKILAFNSLGFSEFSPLMRITTPRTQLEPYKLPKVLNAHFNEVHEAICFELSEPFQRLPADDFLVKIDVGLNDELVTAAQDLIRLNNRTNGPLFSSGQQRSLSLKQFRSTLDSLSNQPIKTKSYLVDLSSSHNCILYSQLVNLDYQLRANTTISNKQYAASKKSSVYAPIVYNLHAIMSNSVVAAASAPLPIMSSIYSKYSASSKVENLVNNFFEFKKFHRVNVTLCYKNDSSICADKISVYG
jgi:hypothetical protein